MAEGLDDRAVEEVAYRNRPPLLEDVSIRGPLRIPVKDSMVTLEQRDAIEADFRWYRYSKFAAPWLLLSFLLLVTLFALTAWQQVGNVKKFTAEPVGTLPVPPKKHGVPRIFVKKAQKDSDHEGGLPEYLRNIRIATITFGIVSIALVFFTLLVKPRPKVRATLNYLWALLLFTTFVLAIIGFAIGVDKMDDAVQCPSDFETTYEKCVDRKGIATVTVAVEAGVAAGALVSTILLAFFTSTGDWKLFRTGWRERERDAETDIHNDSPEQARFRKVRDVRMTTLIIALVLTALALIVLFVFVVVLREDRKIEVKKDAFRNGIRGIDLEEESGWPSRNTRLRYGYSAIGILAIIVNLYPFVHRAIHYFFFFLYFTVAVLAFVTFGFDVHELVEADDLPCTLGGTTEAIDCGKAPFVATVVIEFIAGLTLLFYFLYEFLAKSFVKSRWSQREYAPHELHKHDTKLDSLRPVRCEVTGKTMTAKEYVYRWRFIAGTAQAEPEVYTAPVAEYSSYAPISTSYVAAPYAPVSSSYVAAPPSSSYVPADSGSFVAPPEPVVV